MHVGPDPDTRSSHGRATIKTIIDLARDDLPEVARLAAIALAAPHEHDGRSLLVRAYDVAFDAEHEYLAELLDMAIGLFAPPAPA